ncbi:hypothetical protein BpHYR1_005985 [Brachionus plicatilis]|uniref:Uncharacterized protein n=1 Tax=Brachionus plicatilis TaxID=10195 RepID=A0A3M7SW97_BRAPC|nr:hypothetical protein BpHYR1_005985 [Brachionus plicatilis]
MGKERIKTSSSNHDSKEDKTEIKIDSSRSSQTNILNCSTLSNNSQSSNPRPSRIPKLSVNQKTVNQTKAAESAKKARYPSSTRIPQRARPSTPKTSHKNLPFSEPITPSKVINSTTFDKSVAHISDSCIVPECKEVKLFINKNLVDILLVAKNSEPKARGRDDEGYSTMSSEIMHRAQNSNRTSAGNTETQSRTSEASSTIDETNSLSSPPPNLHNSKKRYCFPTLKTLNYYYNNRYYHQYHKRASSQSSIVCCKYLSDSDIQALSNQLNSFDKDTFYNVFHLDTLYSNVDYILFNSYASDTELEYNYNRRHGRYHDVLDSNYQLYINDYFNQPYDDDEDDDERQSATETEESRDSEENFVEYELKDDQFEFEIDGSNENFVELSVDGTDGLLFDDEDVNLILDSEQIDENFCLNEYKNMFDQSKFDSPLFSSQSISSLKSTSCSSSSCEYPSSNDLSLDSINPKVEKNSASLNCDYFVDSYDNYQLHDENVMLIDELSLDNNFDISDFVNQLNYIFNIFKTKNFQELFTAIACRSLTRFGSHKKQLIHPLYHQSADSEKLRKYEF